MRRASAFPKSSRNKSIRTYSPSIADYIWVTLFSAAMILFWAYLWADKASLCFLVYIYTSFFAWLKFARAWSTISSKFVMALTEFWCLSDAALRLTSSDVISFLFALDLIACVLAISVGMGLNALGSAPVGNFTCGYLLSVYYTTFLYTTVECLLMMVPSLLATLSIFSASLIWILAEFNADSYADLMPRASVIICSALCPEASMALILRT